MNRIRIITAKHANSCHNIPRWTYGLGNAVQQRPLCKMTDIAMETTRMKQPQKSNGAVKLTR